jgi:RNA polymerase sigma-70 factor (ECF subfamily)
VRQTSEVIELADSRPTAVDRGSERREAFLRLANERLDASYRLARAILRNPTEAEDATHDAIVQAWGKWSTLRDQDRFTQWFDRILINVCRNRLQRASRNRTTDISAEVAFASGDAMGRTHDRDLMGGAIATLTPEHRLVVALRYYRDLTIGEIAAQLDIPVGTVQSRLHYALKRLHAVIDAADSRGSTS